MSGWQVGGCANFLQTSGTPAMSRDSNLTMPAHVNIRMLCRVDDAPLSLVPKPWSWKDGNTSVLCRSPFNHHQCRLNRTLGRRTILTEPRLQRKEGERMARLSSTSMVVFEELLLNLSRVAKPKKPRLERTSLAESADGEFCSAD